MALSFVDASGNNPLPAGIIVSLYAQSGPLVGMGMLQAGGVYPQPFAAGSYTASFVGTQAPAGSVSFVSTGSSLVVAVPNYQSPVYSAAGYAAEAAYHLTRGWFTNPNGTSTLPSGVGPVLYPVLLALGEGKEIADADLQQVLGALRLPSSQGASIDSFAYDFFAGTFYRFAQYGETDAQWISRIESIFSIEKATVAGMQAIINVFWPWILLQMGATNQNLAFDTGLGGYDTTGGVDFTSSSVSANNAQAGQSQGVDTFGGDDNGSPFIDGPAPTLLTPVPVVFDSQSNPTLSALIQPNIVPLQFCIYLRYLPNSDALIRPINSPSAILTALVNAWKPVGTTPIYANNL